MNGILVILINGIVRPRYGINESGFLQKALRINFEADFQVPDFVELWYLQSFFTQGYSVFCFIRKFVAEFSGIKFISALLPAPGCTIRVFHVGKKRCCYGNRCVVFLLLDCFCNRWRDRVVVTLLPE